MLHAVGGACIAGDWNLFFSPVPQRMWLLALR